MPFDKDGRGIFRNLAKDLDFEDLKQLDPMSSADARDAWVATKTHMRQVCAALSQRAEDSTREDVLTALAALRTLEAHCANLFR